MRSYCKFITFLSLLLLTYSGYGQVIVTRSPSSVQVQDYNVDILGRLKIPVFADTSVLIGRDSLGMIIYSRAAGKMYVRDSSAPWGHKWTAVGTGSGSTTDTTSLSNRINLKVDSVTRGTDTTYYWTNGTRHFGYKGTISLATLLSVLGYTPLAATDTVSLSNRINAKKYNSDSTGPTSYVPRTQIDSFKTTVDSSRTATWAALASKMTNFGSAPGQVQFNLASIPAATGYPTGTTLIAPDSGFHYVDTGSGGSRGWKKISGGASGGSGGTAANPTAKVGTSAVNGSASTFMRSDAAPPLDTLLFPTLWSMYKNAAAGDTLVKLIFGIPQPDVSGGTTQATPMPWKWLTTGGGHMKSPYADDPIFVNGGGSLLIGFGNTQYVSFADYVGDELQYPLKCGIIGNFTNYEVSLHVASSGFGGTWQGNNTNTLQLKGSQMYNYAITFDSTTQSGPLTVSFDLADGAGMSLGSGTHGTILQYTGSNGYIPEQVWTGLTRTFKFIFHDAWGNVVTGYPQSTDLFKIFNGSTNWATLDCRQFLNTTNAYFGSSLSNGWFVGIIKIYPEDQWVSKPGSFTAVASGTAGQINVTWSASTNVTAGYTLDRCTQANFATGVTSLIAGTVATSFNDTGLTTGTKYWYRIKANRTFPQDSGWEEVGPITAP